MHSTQPVTCRLNLTSADQCVLEHAASIISKQFVQSDVFTSVDLVKQFLSCKLATQQREVFSVMLLTNQHHLISYQELFYGTIDGASIYPREVVKLCLQSNAAAVIFAHNHPSGVTEPSSADKQITQRLKSALGLVDIRVLDHFIVGANCFSMAEHGMV
ncbi:JAB domain-containing protein [Gayadomonas joobiniege]|uniref:JAB domain-containing protein n=1 Tax=Gayadomonas joobiniege TaxID=1234606 RepID=UPI0003770B4F|nr:JAB domain-containing protein [Gayadomonas joobiniege]